MLLNSRNALLLQNDLLSPRERQVEDGTCAAEIPVLMGGGGFHFMHSVRQLLNLAGLQIAQENNPRRV